MKTKNTQTKKHTGRNLILLNSNLKRERFFKATHNASIRMAHYNDYALHPENFDKAFSTGDGIYFEMLNVAVINFNREDEIDFVNRELAGKGVLSVEPERYVYKIGTRKVKAPADNAEFSWGIKATGVFETPFTGKGVNIAILDTGVFKQHEDLKGRNIKTKKFVSTGKAGDVDGHGSHCTGIACGYKDADGFRYGVACESNIFVGKVLDDQGEGTDGGILAGIEWAMTNKCRVISMSLGAASQPGEPYSETYESVAKRAVKNGALIVAAAGNESNRPSFVAPVGHPANCPSIMAVGAVDSSMKIAPFSCGGTKAKGGQVDIAAPGVSVYSMINEQGKHEKWDGTSMATPFVAGIAGLFFEQNKKAGPLGVWALITQHAKRLKLSSVDAGSGLVQAP
ncbi:MAG TPA: S8 family serine peptidase [Bacteroidales bacterium]|nr:S8 family serine peptidase [Bacteroidales bacterium]